MLKTVNHQKEAHMIKERILRPDRIRKTEGRFSFIPHRFLLDGFLKSLSENELLLYFFLVLASDKNGVSYYGKASILAHIHMAENDYEKARNGLIERDLLSFDGVFYQVLDLPRVPVHLVAASPLALEALCRKIGTGGAS